MSLRVALRHAFPGLALDVAFEAPTPGVTVLFGPSGCGKSSVILAIAGLLQAEHCVVSLDGTVLAAPGIVLPPERRRLGLVFQEGRLFPHMSVEANLRYGLRRAPDIRIGFGEVVELLGLGPLLGRRSATLSGGERQRVAIGRALLAQPRLLLMDEPLAALDAARRDEILPYLARLKTRLHLPILYVTHAMDEVARLADTLVLMEAGRVRAAGAVAEIAAGADLPLAGRGDAAGLLHGRIAGHEAESRLTLVAAGGIVVRVPAVAASPGRAVRLRIPAREVILALRPPEAISIHNILPATVRGLAETGGAALVELDLARGGGRLLARVTPDAVARLGLAPGTPVLALVKSVAVDVLLEAVDAAD
ncbi:MAG TPA: molybdenum ABC transporter ATP-binding protein [Acetobacteraceae bacterium]|nr:molybdenum ABC transporter ATP-binding protein [Acetobacteraceae bacterium]